MFVIVRHGNTFEPGEAALRIGARSDPPLTAAGRDQAQKLGEYFAARGWHFSSAEASPLSRTWETCKTILACQPTKVPMQPAEFLKEIDHGPDEGLPEADITDRIGRAALDAWETQAKPPAGWIADADKRIAAWKSVFKAESNCAEPRLFVTSNGAARFALLAAPELRASAGKMPTMKLPTGGFGVISRNAAGELALEHWGKRP